MKELSKVDNSITSQSWREEYKRKLTTADEAAKLISNNDRVSIQGGTGIPPAFMAALAKRAPELRGVVLGQGFALAFHDHMKPEYKDSFHIETAFMGPAERFCLEMGTADFVPFHLGNAGKWYDETPFKKVACVVTPPDEYGYMNRSCFGGLCTKRLCDRAEKLIVEVNENTPWLYSDVFNVHVSQCDAIIENTQPITEIPEIPVTPVEEKIAQYIADMIPNGSTIQLGLGGLANCIGHFLKDKKDLGIHSEVVSNSIMELVKCGAVNGSKKTLLPGKVAYTFCVGTSELNKFLDHNEMFHAFEIEIINNPTFIARNNNFVSVNNALMVDLTGQIASESIGTRQYSATGGQAQFVQGARLAPGGKSIIALPSTRTDKEGKTHSRIVPVFPIGTVVSSSRNDVQWVVTEYGGVDLTFKSLSSRVRDLIGIAHPDFRDELEFDAKKIGWI